MMTGSLVSLYVSKKLVLSPKCITVERDLYPYKDLDVGKEKIHILLKMSPSKFMGPQKS